MAKVEDLEIATRPRPRDDGTFDLEIPEKWEQGRGAFGGLVVAALVRAAEHACADPERRLRSLTAELPGPAVPGGARISVENLRTGSGVTTLAARLVQEGEVKTFAVAVLARSRAADAESYVELTPPALRDFRSMEPLPMAAGVPVFAQHFEYRSDGPYPFTSGNEALATGWIRARRASAMSTGAYLAAMIDTFWPATFARTSGPRPVATVSFTMQILGDPGPLDPELPLAYRGRVWVQSQGWFVEQRELWSPAGDLLALNQQTFAIVR